MFRLTDWLFLALNYWLLGGVRFFFREHCSLEKDEGM